MSPGLQVRILALVLCAGTTFMLGWRAGGHAVAHEPGPVAPAPAAPTPSPAPPAPPAPPPAVPPAPPGAGPARPRTEPPAARTDGAAGARVPEQYTVRAGDTLYEISRRLGVDVGALMAANGLSSHLIRVGQVLTVPTGAPTRHTVRPGDTAWDVARQYGISLEALAASNRELEDLGWLQVGAVLTLPAGARYGAARGAPVPAIASGAAYVWPVRGWISSPFGPRVSPVDGVRRDHAGIDIAANAGDPIVAARDGVVVSAGPMGSYGNTVILEHADGTRTLYAHAANLAVRAGQKVQQGEVIARVGSTGASTGPHLHFEIIAGRPVDPLSYLQGTSQAGR